MKLKTAIASLFVGLLMAGGVQAMDSKAIEEHMAKIQQQYEQDAKADKVKALEKKVEELEEMVQMMLDDQES